MADNMLGRELMRHDTKASLLIAIDGGILALVATITRSEDLGWEVCLPGTFGLAVLAASILILLLSIRPALAGRAGEGWELWADLDRETIMAHMRTDRSPERVLFLSRIVRRKFQQLQIAVDLLIGGLLLLAVATFIAAVRR
ncbi:Pycsar system effector family protein [Streptomyces sp. NPDC096013]|uniref:Pycsar system effector family protein n=1 Tax=Streptomyces sp. NPDC096013 TaxID=3366069 RepID=UPI003807F4D4